MKWWLCLWLLLALQASNAEADAALTAEEAAAVREHSVSSVVDLLKAMSQTIAQETDEDQKSHDKLMCWCTAEKKEKLTSIDQGTAKINELEATLDGLAVSRAELDASIKDLQQQVTDGQAALEQATAVREEQKQKFTSYDADTTTYLVSLEAAIGALTKRTGRTALPQVSAFMQMFSHGPPASTAAPMLETDMSSQSEEDETFQGDSAEKRLRGTAGVNGWSSDDQDAVQRGLSAAMTFMQSSRGRAVELYSPGSTGELIGMFKQMMSSMQEDLEAAREAEKKAAQDFEDLREARLEEIKQAISTVERKKGEKAHASEAIALAKSEKKQQNKVLAASREALATTTQRCEEAERGHVDRQQARQREAASILEAIQVLSDQTQETVVSFLQLSSTREARARSLASAMRSAANAAEGSHTSRSMESLAAAAEADSFKKVRDAIDSMVRELKQQHRLESQKKDWCKQEFFENKRATKASLDHQTTLEAKVTQIRADIKTIQGDLDLSAKKMGELTSQLQTAGAERKEEQSAFQKTHWDQQMTLRALKRASQKLSEVYSSEQSPSFLQHKALKEVPGYKRNRMGGTVLELLKTLMEEAQDLVQKAAKSENQAEATYGKFVAETKSLLEALQVDVVTKKRAIATAQKSRVRADQDVRANAQEQSDLVAQKANLEAQCNALIKDFDQSSAKRQAEIEALTQSKAVLAE
mmetsp:Transcript_2959/g.5119  ORF Transcript_2959/g.5119 Transcript_2959/m.5119 type:complete len:702 (+) Transcript_2959:98-2203(+)